MRFTAGEHVKALESQLVQPTPTETILLSIFTVAPTTVHNEMNRFEG